ncbi:NYN domain-containing protein [Aerococcaceae bacterium DSM 111020]|nr:NYN domain-containing protein [Aerococcaceae bacterium DSM 111020]
MRRQEILIVDGYNIIGAWPELNRLKKENDIQSARDLLLFELSNYRKYNDIQIIVVFDAQFVPGITQSFDAFDIQVVFTSEGETADSYIERRVKEYINPLTRVVVATSDAAEQWMVFQHGALRKSAKELRIDIDHTKKQINNDVQDYYSTIQRRHSLWKIEDLEYLDFLRHHIDQD